MQARLAAGNCALVEPLTAALGSTEEQSIYAETKPAPSAPLA